MRTRQTWPAVVAFSLVFPFLMVMASPKGFSDLSAVPQLLGVEALLLFGIMVASKERKRFERESLQPDITAPIAASVTRLHHNHLSASSASARVSAR